MNPSAITNGAGPAVSVSAPKPPQVTSLPASAPKPVQVMSVENTPLHGNTPAGGSPAPELRIEQEPVVRKAQDDNNAILGPHDPSVPKKTVPEPVVDIAGPDTAESRRASDPSAGETPSAKRRTEEGMEATDTKPSQPPAPTDLNTAVDDQSGQQGGDARPEKKAKITDKAADLLSNVKSKIEQKVEDKKAGSKGNISRSNKDKPRAAAGRTERKTRSQGPADAL